MVISKSLQTACIGKIDLFHIRTKSIREKYGNGWGTETGREVYTNELLRLRKYLENGEAIRAWYSDTSYFRCGFYSLCRILQNYKNEVHIVKLPEYVGKKRVLFYRNWGEVSAEEFAGFLIHERMLTKEEVRMYALLWTELPEDNCPPRAVINGRVTGVQEDFYDFLIWRRLTCRPVKEARLICIAD